MSEPYRDPQTEQAIADARVVPKRYARLIDEARAQGGDREADAVAMALEGPFDDVPGPQPPQPPLPTVLEGEEQSAYWDFCHAAQALEAHQRAATPVLERYKAALARLSACAARSGG